MYVAALRHRTRLLWDLFKLKEVPLQVIWAVGLAADSIFLCGL